MTVDRDAGQARPRPGWVTLLAVLNILGGLGMLLLATACQPALRELSGASEEIGLPLAGMRMAVPIFGVVQFSAGIGLWTGVRWGWWLAAFSYFFSSLRRIATAVALVLLMDRIQLDPQLVVRNVGRTIGGVSINALILVYLFSGKVLGYFGMEELRKLRAVAILLGITMAAGMLLMLDG